MHEISSRRQVTEADEGSGLSPEMQQFYQEIEERRLKEWENYQKSHRSADDRQKNRAFLDISIGGSLAGRLVVDLFESDVPNTVARFRELASGSGGIDAATGIKLDYLRTGVTQISLSEGLVRMDGLESNGAALQCIPDENFNRRHNERGLLSMISNGPNTATGGFCITLRPTPNLDFTQVVFGKVTDGLILLDKLESVPTNAAGVPLSSVFISFSGVLTGPKPPATWNAAGH